LNHVIDLQFEIADEFDQYERVLFSITNLLVQVGGSFNSLKAIGFMVTAVFSYRLFYASLIRALFHFDTSNAEWEKTFKKAEKQMKKKMVKRAKENNKEAIDYLQSREKQGKNKKQFSDIDKLKF